MIVGMSGELHPMLEHIITEDAPSAVEKGYGKPDEITYKQLAKTLLEIVKA